MRTTSEKIASIARRVVEREGSDAVGIRRIAGAAGLSAMAFYRHYRDRDALLNVIADAGFDELAGRLRSKRLTGTPTGKLVRLMDVYLDFSLEHPRLFELMFLEKRAGARRFPADFGAGRSPTANVVAAVVKQGIESGFFKKLDVWEVVFTAGAQAHGLTLLFLGGRIDWKPAQFRAFYRRSFRRLFDAFRA